MTILIIMAICFLIGFYNGRASANWHYIGSEDKEPKHRGLW
ncbi:unnamed protein product [marine sediment metagenome]|uniref:Uncharacterized protein n=1 Tax=marine sediment metagenome TaxID=412755 RepID=X0SU54_9ZZZZ